MSSFENRNNDIIRQILGEEVKLPNNMESLPVAIEDGVNLNEGRYPLVIIEDNGKVVFSITQSFHSLSPYYNDIMPYTDNLNPIDIQAFLIIESHSVSLLFSEDEGHIKSNIETWERIVDVMKELFPDRQLEFQFK